MADDDQLTEERLDALLRQTLRVALDTAPVQADWPALAALLVARQPPKVASSLIAKISRSNRHSPHAQLVDPNITWADRQLGKRADPRHCSSTGSSI